MWHNVYRISRVYIPMAVKEKKSMREEYLRKEWKVRLIGFLKKKKLLYYSNSMLIN